MFAKSRASSWSRLLIYRSHLRSSIVSDPNAVRIIPSASLECQRNFSVFDHFSGNLTPWNASQRSRFSAYTAQLEDPSRLVEEFLKELKKDQDRERAERRRQGLDTKDIDEEDEEDYMGVRPLIEKLESQKPTEDSFGDDEPSDSDSETDEMDLDEERKQHDIFNKKFQRHKEMIQSLGDSETLDEAIKWMNKVDKFEEKHFNLRPEYRVIGDLLNRLKVAEGKEKFILQQKLNRAMKLLKWKETFDPNNPANYGVIEREDSTPGTKEENDEKDQEFLADKAGEDKTDDDDDEDDDAIEEFDDMKERDDMLLEKLNAIDKELEQKLAELDRTFGKKGKRLEEEIKELAEERNVLTEKKKQPLYRKGFDVRTININRTCKVTKGGRIERYTALLVCGNYEGTIGYAKAKADSAQTAIQKAYEKCFHNLHYIERHEEHTIAHAIQTSYKKTKLYLWPAPTTTGMKAGKTVKVILNLAGFKNVKSKVIGSRNPHNTVMAVLKALNAIETPKDVQEKFGRTVVEKYLL